MPTAAELGVKDFQPYQSGYEEASEPEEPDDPVSFLPPPPMDENVREALSDAADFYNHILQQNADRFPKVMGYLGRRGIRTEIIDRFQIGYAPALGDKHYAGRALKETDATIAGWLSTSRQTISKYKTYLHRLGYLNIDTSTRVQKLSVQFSPK